MGFFHAACFRRFVIYHFPDPFQQMQSPVMLPFPQMRETWQMRSGHTRSRGIQGKELLGREALYYVRILNGSRQRDRLRFPRPNESGDHTLFLGSGLPGRFKSPIHQVQGRHDDQRGENDQSPRIGDRGLLLMSAQQKSQRPGELYARAAQ